MREIDPFEPAAGARFVGVLDAAPTKDGVRLRRLPAWTRQMLLDPGAAFAATVTSGVKLEMVTDSTSVELDVLLGWLAYGELPVAPAIFELGVDGDVVASQPFDEGNVF